MVILGQKLGSTGVAYIAIVGTKQIQDMRTPSILPGHEWYTVRLQCRTSAAHSTSN